jgi:hypothetical protein
MLTSLRWTLSLPGAFPVVQIWCATGLTKPGSKYSLDICKPLDWLPRSRFVQGLTGSCLHDCLKTHFQNIIPTMATVTFDTLQLVEQLRSAGISQEQAEALVKVIAKSQDGLLTQQGLETALTPLRTDLAVLKWMMGLMIAGVMSLVLKTFF